MAWALWGSILFSLPLEGKTIEALENSEDSIVAILALDAQEKGLLSRKLNTQNWEAIVLTEGLYGNIWLLAYESDVQGWSILQSGMSIVDSDSVFGFLKSNGVKFYDRDLSDKFQPKIPPGPVIY